MRVCDITAVMSFIIVDGCRAWNVRVCERARAKAAVGAVGVPFQSGELHALNREAFAQQILSQGDNEGEETNPPTTTTTPCAPQLLLFTQNSSFMYLSAH